MPTMIESNLQDDTLYFRVNTPRLDAATAREFKTECSEHWNPGIQRLTINMAMVDFLDSSGIGALLSVYKRLTTPQSIMRLVDVKPAVQSVLELMRMHRLFEIRA
jgi:anti-sigma B factor antagonist